MMASVRRLDGEECCEEQQGEEEQRPGGGHVGFSGVVRVTVVEMMQTCSREETCCTFLGEGTG